MVALHKQVGRLLEADVELFKVEGNLGVLDHDEHAI